LLIDKSEKSCYNLVLKDTQRGWQFSRFQQFGCKDDGQKMKSITVISGKGGVSEEMKRIWTQVDAVAMQM
jgi:hypothetical protein